MLVDNTINQLLVLKVLERHNYQATLAENGRVAVEKFLEGDFDIIPIVAMIAHTIKGDYEKCMAIGINEYISKTFHPDELYEKIQLLIAQKSNSEFPVPVR